MSKPISIGQSHNLMAVLANNVDWSRVSGDSAQGIIDDPQRAGKNFTEFLRRVGTLPRALKSLKLVQNGIQIATEPFAKDSFFKKGPVKLYFWDNSENRILTAMSDTIPAFQGTLVKLHLAKNMYDSEILSKLGQPKPFTVGEFAAVIRDMLVKQPQGENGTLLTNGYANIFYVQLENSRVVAVLVHWHAGDREWLCRTHDLIDGRRHVDYCVFFRS